MRDDADNGPNGDAGPGGDRDSRGRFRVGNGAALVTGSRSVQFWEAHDEAQRAIVGALLADQGHDVDDAPKALLLAAQSLAQAVLVRDAAYHRVAEAGGPLTSKDRVRRALVVWQGAVDRVEKHVRLLGLERRQRDVVAASPAEWLARQGGGA